MDSQGKAKVALTFALYQGDQLVRRDTIVQDIVKVGKDPRSHLRVDDELASRMHAVIEVASPLILLEQAEAAAPGVPMTASGAPGPVAAAPVAAAPVAPPPPPPPPPPP